MNPLMEYTEKKICPFMSRFVSRGSLTGNEFCMVDCQKQKCMAWVIHHEKGKRPVKIIQYCALIGRT